MAKGPAKTQARPKASAAPTAPKRASRDSVGPPLLLVALGYLSVLVSLPLITADGIPAHLVGYAAGALIPIFIIGLVRRVDLSRHRSPYYVARPIMQPALVLLAIAAVVAAGLHVWPIATELAS